MSYVLDTHVLLYWLERSRPLTPVQEQATQGRSAADPLAVPEIVLWEVATLHRLRRIALPVPLRYWLERAVTGPNVRTVGISPAIAAATADLPRSFHGDPADRLIVATALVLGATLLTQDRKIIAAGVVPTG